MREFYRVPVAEVVRETDDACSLVLEVPPPLAGSFGYLPGQFVTVRGPAALTGSGARGYSLSRSPVLGEQPAITVQRTGDASCSILDRLAAGPLLPRLPPRGPF